LTNGLLRPVDDPAEGTEHPLQFKGGDPFQGIEDGIDIFILSQVSQVFTNKEVPGEEPSFVGFVKADMVL
jgi:hypothetical protein